MLEVLVALPSGAGVVHADHGLLVTGEVGSGGGAYLREEDQFSPVSAWVNETHSVVGGVLPPGAVRVEVVDDRGARVPATVDKGVYAAMLEQPSGGHEAIVCCRDVNGNPVRRPWAADYPSVVVTDTQERCPACGAVDWEEYTPFEEWRGGRGSKVDGTHVPNPVVSCRVCGHDEPEGTFYAYSSDEVEAEDEAARAARLARAHAEFRKRRWLSGRLTLRAAAFPIYGVDGWPAQLGGSRSQNDELTEITIDHYEHLDADPFTGDRPRLAITTKRGSLRPDSMLSSAREGLENWLRQDTADWPNASHAAVTLWLRARGRATRGAVLDSVQSEHRITIDGVSVPMLTLNAPGHLWVAVTSHTDLTISVAARDVDPISIDLEPIADPAAQLLGPEPPDA